MERPSSSSGRQVARSLPRLPAGWLWCLMVGWLGCHDAREPRLPVSEVRYWSMPADGAKVPAPRSAEIDGPETYVLDTVGRVLVFDAQGQLARSWRMPDSSAGRPEDLLVLGDGRIAVADTHYHQVLLFDPQGNVVDRWGSYGKELGQFDYPVALAEDSEGHLFVAEYGGNDRIQKFSPTGTCLLAFGSFGTAEGEFQRPSGLAWNAGHLYVADAINNRILVFKDDGTYLRDLTAGQNYHLAYPYDVELAGNNDLIVIEYGAGCVTHLSTGGTLLGRWSTSDPEVIRLATPWGVAVDGQRIVIADTGNRRIVELRK